VYKHYDDHIIYSKASRKLYWSELSDFDTIFIILVQAVIYSSTLSLEMQSINVNEMKVFNNLCAWEGNPSN